LTGQGRGGGAEEGREKRRMEEEEREEEGEKVSRMFGRRELLQQHPSLNIHSQL